MPSTALDEETSFHLSVRRVFGAGAVADGTRNGPETGLGRADSDSQVTAEKREIVRGTGIAGETEA